MKSLLLSAALALAALAAPAAHAGDVGVSISVGQPGFYGQIQLGGGYPPPAVIYTEPVLVQRVYAPPPPVYLRVPPDHYRHWSRHCGFYRACGRPVYFVREDWYARTYAPAYARPHPYPVYGPPPRWDGRRDWDRRDWEHRHWERREHDRRAWEGRDWDRRDGRGDGRRDWDDRREGHHHHRDR